MRFDSFLDISFKHVFVDFDSTLYLWDNTHRHSRDGDNDWCDWYDWYELDREAYLKGVYKSDDWWEEWRINDVLIRYLSYQKSRDAVIHLVTQTSFSYIGERKKKFMDRCHPGIIDDVYTVAHVEDKIRLMDVVRGNIPRILCLLIDDRIRDMGDVVCELPPDKSLPVSMFDGPENMNSWRFFLEEPQYVMTAELKREGISC